MRLNIEEKKILYAFGCESRENTLKRLKWLCVLAVDRRVKGRMLCIARKLEQEDGSCYLRLYEQIRIEMDDYFKAERTIRETENRNWWDG